MHWMQSYRQSRTTPQGTVMANNACYMRWGNEAGIEGLEENSTTSHGLLRDNLLRPARPPDNFSPDIEILSSGIPARVQSHYECPHGVPVSLSFTYRSVHYRSHKKWSSRWMICRQAMVFPYPHRPTDSGTIRNIAPSDDSRRAHEELKTREADSF